MSDQTDPLRLFKGAVYDTPRGPLQTYCCAAIDRISCASRSNDRAALEDAMRAPKLQKSVQAAIRARLKKL